MNGKWLKILGNLFASVVIITGVFTLIASAVYANEGTILLQSGSVVCTGVSFWDGNWYKVNGICHGLVYPYQDQLDSYVLWVVPETGGSAVRISSVDKGIFDGSTDQRFRSIFITAETNSTPYRPSPYVLLSGTLNGFVQPAQQNTSYGTTQQTQTAPMPTVVMPTPTIQPQGNVTSSIIHIPGMATFLGLAAAGVVAIGLLYMIRR